MTDALGQYPGDPNHTISFTYDTAGRKKTVTRPNGQSITYNTFDVMNRVTQQTATQTPDPAAVTKYTYYTPSDGASAPVGLLHTMQAPHLVALNNGEAYTYTYDNMGRKTILRYPADSGGYHWSEVFNYDTAGRLGTYQNRGGSVQTYFYDALNRMIYFTWSDGFTPRVDFGYDVGSRLTSITNANATISRTYFNDNLLNTETETITISGGVARPVTYTYDADGNRATLQFPGYSGTYSYTGRDQLKSIVDVASGLTSSYWYDLNGNLIQRNPGNSTSSSYSYDALGRVTNVTHSLSGDTRTLDYAYDNVGNRKWTKRDNGNGDVFGYDLSDQVMAVKLNIASPDTTGVGSQTIHYDANGNRTTFAAYGPTDTYTTNNLNQYSQRNSTTATYDATGNMRTGVDGSTYFYDAQNRLLTATTSGATETFNYDGLNRQVTRTVAGVATYNVYDGWNLIQEYQTGGAVTVSYFHGAGGLVKNIGTGGINRYYYQDASGSTPHLADSNGNLLEWYRYDLQGTPVVYNGSDVFQPGGSNFGIRHLFTGQQWYSELGLYDLRNRYYSPDIGRFLQADPIGFNGDATNLYRYCGNNPLKLMDPSGTIVVVAPGSNAGAVMSAIDYLMNSQTFAGIYSNLQNSSNVYTISTNSTGQDSFLPNTVRWDPSSGGCVTSGEGVQSPALILAHELAGHAEDWDTNPQQYINDLNTPNPSYDKQEEYNAVQTETQIANELGEPTRTDHRGELVPVSSPTTSMPSGGGINTRVPQIIGGVFYPFGFGNISPGMNFGGGTAGTIQGAFTWTTNDSTNSPTLSNFGDINIGAGIGPGEPLDAPELIWSARRGWHYLLAPQRGGDLKVVPHG